MILPEQRRKALLLRIAMRAEELARAHVDLASTYTDEENDGLTLMERSEILNTYAQSMRECALTGVFDPRA